jgi:hypothetical protein
LCQSFARSDERRLAARPAGADELKRLGVVQQVVADVLDRGELAPLTPARNEHAGVAALERVEVSQVEQVAHPPVDPSRLNAVGEMN